MSLDEHELIDDRIYTVVFYCNSDILLLNMEVESKTSGCRTKVGRVNQAGMQRQQELLTNGYREMQLFLVGFIIIEICEIFTVGGFPLNDRVRVV